MGRKKGGGEKITSSATVDPHGWLRNIAKFPHAQRFIVLAAYQETRYVW